MTRASSPYRNSPSRSSGATVMSRCVGAGEISVPSRVSGDDSQRAVRERLRLYRDDAPVVGDAAGRERADAHVDRLACQREPGDALRQGHVDDAAFAAADAPRRIDGQAGRGDQAHHRVAVRAPVHHVIQGARDQVVVPGRDVCPAPRIRQRSGRRRPPSGRS